MLTGPRVLVLRFSSLGDVVLVTPLLRAIARRHPTAQVTIVTKQAHAELLVERALGCRPCSVFGSNHCPLGHHRCMIEIAPEDVARAVMAAG